MSQLQKESVASLNVHLLTVEEVSELLHTDVTNGLSSGEASSRKGVFGANKFDTEGKITWPQILAYHLFNMMNFVYVVAMALAFVVLSWIDAGVILAVIIINTTIGFMQEYKSEKVMASLRDISFPQCTVIRDGQRVSIDTYELVPGDVISVKQGDMIPADARLFRIADLETDEALLTGESEPIKKHINPIVLNDGDRGEVNIGDRKNVIFMNTNVSKGRGRAIVFATGNNTEMGKIASTLLHSKKVRTPLQQRLDKLGMYLSFLAIACIGLVLLTGWAWGTFDVYPDGLRTANAAAVAVIPQAIVVVISLTLTVGVKVLGSKNVLVKKLHAVETLGNITNICSDKTGTLTQGKMLATELRLTNNSIYHIHGEGLIPKGDIVDMQGNVVDIEMSPLLSRAVSVASLCNTATISFKEDEEGNGDSEGEWVGLGSPTEVALIVLGTKAGITKQTLSNKYEFIAELPFDSTLKRMTAIYTDLETREKIIFTKGAPERILDMCASSQGPDGTVRFDAEQREFVRGMNREMAAEGLRVLALAYRTTSSEVEGVPRDVIEQELILVGLVGIRDPPRDGVQQAIQVCHGAGIAVHMITGDHPITARAIAIEIGIFSEAMPLHQVDSLIMTANNFNALTDDELHALKSLPLVIARCSPESKVRMVEELQRRKRKVAMLGDGVNDSPAIKIADVGIAMGINGSDVTKEAADLILLDDNFITVLTAIKEGRKIFQNIRRFIIFLLTCNIAEASVIVFGVMWSLDPPLTPMEVLWLNMITSAPPAFLLGIVPEKAWYMDKYKRKVNENFFTVETILDIIIYGLVVGGLSIVNFVIARFVFDLSLRTSQGATFAAITMMIMFHSYTCREMRGHFWRGGFIRAKWLHLAVLFGIGTLFFTYYTPVFQDSVFEHRPPDYRCWLVAIATVVVFLTFSEIYKLIKKPFRKRSHAKELESQARHDEYMLFNTNPKVLEEEEADFPENEAEEVEDYPEYHHHAVDPEELDTVNIPIRSPLLAQQQIISSPSRIGHSSARRRSSTPRHPATHSQSPSHLQHHHSHLHPRNHSQTFSPSLHRSSPDLRKSM